MTTKIAATIALTPEIRLEQALINAGIDNPASVTKLTVTGTLTHDDFAYIRENMHEMLEELDMDGASIDEIPEKSFMLFFELSSVVIPDSVTKIGNRAFYCCLELTSINIPKSLVEIGEEAFECCNKFRSIEIPHSTVEIGAGAFNNSGLTSVIIPDSVKIIKEHAFCGCKDLVSVIIPDSITEIGYKAFAFCEKLTSIIIPDSVTKFGNCAFASCSGLTSIIIPDSTVEIGIDVFNGCAALTSISIPNSVKKIGDAAFANCTGLTSLVIPDSIKIIGEDSFNGCENLTSITIPDWIVEIGAGAFAHCTKLCSVKIPASVIKIDDSAFDKCPACFVVHPDNPVYTSENGNLKKNSDTKNLKNKTDMNDVKILSLELFARRFGLDGKRLCYGIVALKDEDIPVVYIEDEDLFINIPGDKMFPTKILKIHVEKCEFIENSDGYVFKTDDKEIFYTHKEVEEFYANKWFSEATLKYIRGY